MTFNSLFEIREYRYVDDKENEYLSILFLRFGRLTPLDLRHEEEALSILFLRFLTICELSMFSTTVLLLDTFNSLFEIP